MRYYHIIDEVTLDEVHPEFRKHIEYYGLGKTRTLQDFFEFSNMDLLIPNCNALSLIPSLSIIKLDNWSDGGLIGLLVFIIYIKVML